MVLIPTWTTIRLCRKREVWGRLERGRPLAPPLRLWHLGLCHALRRMAGRHRTTAGLPTLGDHTDDYGFQYHGAKTLAQR